MVSMDALSRTDVKRPATESRLWEEGLHWCTVTLQEVLARGSRLEASVFGLEGRYAREVLRRCKWPLSTVCGENNGLCRAYRPPLYKRIWSEEGIPYYLPSQATHLRPVPERTLSPKSKVDLDLNRAKCGEVLLTCSGTIGKCTFVSKTLDGLLFSQNIIHLSAKTPYTIGFVYAFLRTKMGQSLLKSNEYGAVISHIDPQHLESVPIPNPPPIVKRRIHDLVMKSYELRDESNELLAKAESLLFEALQLPPIAELEPNYLDPSGNLRSFRVRLSELEGRLDASYHVPIVDAILQKLAKEADEIVTIDDPRISKQIILPGRFSRVYVREGQGAVYFTGKHINELDPSDKKYLAFSQHARKIKEELAIRHNMLLVTCSGTLGNVVLCPLHWDGWVMTHDIIRIVPKDDKVVGYVWVFLCSDYGQQLIKRYSYGAVVQHIEKHHIAKVPIPLLRDKEVQSEINRLALEANLKRAEAYYVEQKAISITNKEVIYATD